MPSTSSSDTESVSKAKPGFLAASGHAGDSRVFFDGNTGEWFTFSRVSRAVAAFADRLCFPAKALGLHFNRNDSASLIAYLAGIEAGHAVVVLDPDLDPDRKSSLISRFEPDYIVTPESNLPAELQAAGSRYSVAALPHSDLVLAKARDPHRHQIHPDLTLLMSTSGSTGSPKLVRLSWRNVESNARQINQALDNGEFDCTVITSPVFNGLGLSIVHTHLLAGGRFTLSRHRVTLREFWDAAAAAECNAIAGTPYFYQVMDRLDMASQGLPSIRKFIQSAGRMPEHLSRKYHEVAVERGGALHLMYGQAEAVARISGLPPSFLPEAARSVGFALPGGRLSVRRDGSDCPPLEEGELVYQGPNVMMGYATGPEDLAKGDVMGGRLATGDLGYFDHRGLFYITGRMSRFVKLFGWRISLDDVEEMLSHAGPVAAVNEQERIVIYTEQDSCQFAECVDQLAAKLRVHPSGFEIRPIAKVPRLANGKTDYRSLAASAAGHAERAAVCTSGRRHTMEE